MSSLFAYITLRHELNEAEQINIGQRCAGCRTQEADVLDQNFLSQLYKRMFGMWRWAGRYRTSARNIGADAYRITMDMHQAIDDLVTDRT